jgi:Arc/MetJ-type ribon-helix-helix transcriptional regulator
MDEKKAIKIAKKYGIDEEDILSAFREKKRDRIIIRVTEAELSDINRTMSEFSFSTRSEFIRHACKKSLKEIEDNSDKLAVTEKLIVKNPNEKNLRAKKEIRIGVNFPPREKESYEQIKEVAENVKEPVSWLVRNCIALYIKTRNETEKPKG